MIFLQASLVLLLLPFRAFATTSSVSRCIFIFKDALADYWLPGACELFASGFPSKAYSATDDICSSAASSVTPNGLSPLVADCLAASTAAECCLQGRVGTTQTAACMWTEADIDISEKEFDWYWYVVAPLVASTKANATK